MNTIEKQQQTTLSKVAVRKQVDVITDRIAEWLLAGLKYMKIEPKIIADLGCGTGIMINKLRTMYPDTSFIAIDQSQDVLQSITPVVLKFALPHENSQPHQYMHATSY